MEEEESIERWLVKLEVGKRYLYDAEEEASRLPPAFGPSRPWFRCSRPDLRWGLITLPRQGVRIKAVNHVRAVLTTTMMLYRPALRARLMRKVGEGLAQNARKTQARGADGLALCQPRYPWFTFDNAEFPATCLSRSMATLNSNFTALDGKVIMLVSSRISASLSARW